MTPRTLALAALLAAAAFLPIVPQGAAFSLPPPPAPPEPPGVICGDLCDPCGPLNCAITVQACEDLTVGADPAQDPTSARCTTGTPCGCACPVVGNTLQIQAAGQELNGWAAMVLPYPFCGVGGSGSLVPGGVNPSGTASGCDTVTLWSYGGLSPSGNLATACATYDPSTSCGGATVSTAPVDLITLGVSGPNLPVDPANVCLVQPVYH